MPAVEYWNLPVKKALRKLKRKRTRKDDAERRPKRDAQREWQLKREGVSESESNSLLTELERKRLWRKERADLARIRSYRKTR